MKRNHHSKCSVSLGAAKRDRNKFISSGEPKARRAEDRSLDHEGLRRFTGLRRSGLLTVTLFALAIFCAPAALRAASISVGVSVGIAPPPIPVYAQPVCPAPGYIWTPGYWAYDPENGYYWVPGTWVMAPTPGFLWTPGYWGWGGAAFIWHAGYWGPHVGFYGGINYGFGYPGRGFEGGEWRGGRFFYNRSVNNFGGVHITNVYDRPVANNFAVNRVSYNGGRGGLGARPMPGELAAQHDRHIEGTPMQQQHEVAAHNNRAQFASVNHGRPDVAATGRPGEFRGAGVVQASRAGGPVEGYHRTNPGTNGYSGGHNSNPGGGGTHQAMTVHQNSPSSYGHGAGQGGTHTPPLSHNEVSRGPATNHQPPSHQQPQHTAHPSGGGGRVEHHESETHR